MWKAQRGRTEVNLLGIAVASFPFLVSIRLNIGTIYIYTDWPLWFMYASSFTKSVVIKHYKIPRFAPVAYVLTTKLAWWKRCFSREKNCRKENSRHCTFVYSPHVAVKQQRHNNTKEVEAIPWVLAQPKLHDAGSGIIGNGNETQLVLHEVHLQCLLWMQNASKCYFQLRMHASVD